MEEPSMVAHTGNTLDPK
jgi:hypothetical protein